MKVRNGFVSNSSSSSFLIRMKSCTAEEFSKVLFGEDSIFTITDKGWKELEPYIDQVTVSDLSNDLVDLDEISEGGKYEKEFQAHQLFTIEVGNEAGMDYKLGSQLEQILDDRWGDSDHRVLKSANYH